MMLSVLNRPRNAVFGSSVVSPTKQTAVGENKRRPVLITDEIEQQFRGLEPDSRWNQQ